MITAFNRFYQLRGYGERQSSPCRLHSFALYDVFTRELMLRHVFNFIARPTDCIKVLAKCLKRAENVPHVSHEPHSRSSKTLSSKSRPPQVIRGVIKSKTGRYESINALETKPSNTLGQNLQEIRKSLLGINSPKFNQIRGFYA